MINLSEVTIEYREVIPENKQSVEFWKWCDGFECYATLTRGDRVIEFGSNGEMHLTIPNIINGQLSDDGAEYVRYSDQLESVGINNDFELEQFLKTVSNAGWEVYRMNPWWEFFAEDDMDGIVPTSSDFYGAIEEAIEVLFDDDYWEAIREDS